MAKKSQSSLSVFFVHHDAQADMRVVLLLIPLIFLHLETLCNAFIFSHFRITTMSTERFPSVCYEICFLHVRTVFVCRQELHSAIRFYFLIFHFDIPFRTVSEDETLHLSLASILIAFLFQLIVS